MQMANVESRKTFEESCRPNLCRCSGVVRTETQQECWICGDLVDNEKMMVAHLKAEHGEMADNIVRYYVQAVRRGVHTGWTRVTEGARR